MLIVVGIYVFISAIMLEFGKGEILLEEIYNNQEVVSREFIAFILILIFPLIVTFKKLYDWED